MVIKSFLCSHSGALKRNLADISILAAIHRGGTPIRQPFVDFVAEVLKTINSGK